MKWIICDIDGTLLNSKKELSEITRTSLIKLQESGVKVVISTGRSYKTVLDLALKLQLDLYGGLISCFNGGIIYDVRKKMIISAKLLQYEEICQIYDYCIRNDLNYLIYGKEDVYVNKLDEISAPGYFGKFGNAHQSLNYIVAKTKEELPKEAYKFSFPEKDHETLMKKLSKEPLNFNAFLTLPNWIEIAPKGVNKGYGVKIIASMLGLDLKEAYSFGDGENDVSMFEVTKYSIAMANALNSIKLKAKEVTLSNDEDGVVYYLKQNNLIKD